MNDKFTTSIDLTDDCGASVTVRDYWIERVGLHMGGDLSVSITMSWVAARQLGSALIEAAAVSERESNS